MNINTLSIFVECMRKRSFAAVARDRNVNPATITRAIRSLEDEIQLRLFQRTTRTIEPSEAGIVYFERIEPLVEELTKAKLEATDIQQHPKGLLRISAPVSFAQLNITPHLPEFSAQFPDITFEYILTDEDLDLIAHHIDIGIRVGPLQDSRLIAIKLAAMDTRVCATPEYLEKHGIPETPYDLKTHNCLTLGYRGFDKSCWRFYCRETNKIKTVGIKEHLSTSNAVTLKQCTLAGMGISLLATWMIGEELKSGRLIDLFPNLKVTSAVQEAGAWMLYPSREYLPNKTRVFIDFLKEKFRNSTDV